MTNLEKQFQNELQDKMWRAKVECNYNPTYFNQMLAEIGGVATAKHLIHKAIQTGHLSDGYTKLYEFKRLDLSMEDSVCKEEYRSLFSTDEIAYCKKVLGK